MKITSLIQNGRITIQPLLDDVARREAAQRPFTQKDRDTIRGFLEQNAQGDFNPWFDYQYRTVEDAYASACDWLSLRVAAKLKKELGLS